MIGLGALSGINGIIDRSSKSKDLFYREQERERLELVKGPTAVDNKGKVTTDTYIEEIIKEGIAKREDTIKNPDGSYEFTTDNGYNVKVEPDGDYNVIITIIDKITATGVLNFSDVTWSSGHASVKVSKRETNDKQIQYRVYKLKNEQEEIVKDYTTIENGGTISNLEHDYIVEACILDGGERKNNTTIHIVDNVKPTVNVTVSSTNYNSIGVSVSATDNESGMPSSPTYEYYLDGVLKATTTVTSYTYSDLVEGKKYSIKVTTKDNEENVGIGTVTATTKAIDPAKGSITFTDMKWENESVSVKVNKTVTNNFGMIYQVFDSSNTVKVNDTTILSGGTISGLKAGDLVHVYFANGSRKGSDPATLQITDTEKPTVSMGPISPLYTKIKINLTASDNQSGIKEYAYYIRTAHTNDEYTICSQSKNSSYTYEKLAQGGIYDLKVVVYDNAGNYTESVISSVSTNKCSTCNGTRIERKKCTYCTNGYLYNTCSNCNGTGMNSGSSCSTCGGSGTIACDVCGGTGGTSGESTPCGSCGGSGVMESSCTLCGGSGMMEMSCPACGGLGSMGYDEATGMQEPCTSCGGSGMMLEPCGSCGGSGMMQEPCTSCGGLGMMPMPGEMCPMCNGMGTITCPECNGSSSSGSTCTICNGTGKVKAGKCTHCTNGYIESECSTCKGK